MNVLSPEPLDLPFGGVVVTGSLGAIVELMLGRPPRSRANTEEARALAELRAARAMHTAFVSMRKLLPSWHGTYSVKMAAERAAARAAVVRVRSARA